MKKVDANFEKELLEKFKNECINSDADESAKRLVELNAKNSIKVFAMAYNKLVDENYLEK